jgi:hypothetical protein
MVNIAKALSILLVFCFCFFSPFSALAADEPQTPDSCFNHLLESDSDVEKLYYKLGYSHALQDASIHTSMLINAPVLEDSASNSFQVDICIRGDIVQSRTYRNLMRVLFSAGSFLIFHGFCILVTFLFCIGL